MGRLKRKGRIYRRKREGKRVDQRKMSSVRKEKGSTMKADGTDDSLTAGRMQGCRARPEFKTANELGEGSMAGDRRKTAEAGENSPVKERRKRR